MSAGAQAVGFAMFIFSVGYQAGPRFFEVLKKDGLKYLVLAVTVAGSGLLLAVFLSRWMGFAPGTSAGLLAGGLTSSPTLAAAQEAVRGGTVTPPTGWSAEQLIGNITTGYAITYIFGLVGLILIIKLLPALLGVDLAADASRYEAQSAALMEEETAQVAFRVYKVTNPEMTGVPVKTFRPVWDGFSLIRVHREGQVIEPGPEGHLRLGDELSVVGDITLTKELQRFGEDVTYAHAEIQQTDSAQIVVTAREAMGQTLGELDLARKFGVYVQRWQRLGHDIPRNLDVKLERGDVLAVIGPSGNIDDVAAALGSAERPSDTTDMLTFALGIAAGVVLGSLSVTVAGTPIGLGSAGGLLVAGITVGFIRSIRPTFGRMSGGARWLLMELGLLLFMANVAVSAGAGIMDTIKTAGLTLAFCGVLITLSPAVATFFVGRYGFKMNGAILLGAITGSMTSTPSLTQVTKLAKSSVPTIGYVGTYAFANVLLAIAGTLIMLL